MKNFSELGIKPSVPALTGDKIKIDRIVDKEIVVHSYKVEQSKYNESKCLFLQIELKDEKRVVFTGSANLIDMIQKVPRESFPFVTTIRKDDKRYDFT